MRKLDIRVGDSVAVFGLGPVGLCGGVLARALGGRVIGVDLIPERRELAQKLGAETVVDARTQDPVTAIQNGQSRIRVAIAAAVVNIGLTAKPV